MLDPRFVVVAASFNLAGSSTYVVTMFRGEVQPNRMTWLLWTVMPLLVFAAEVTGRNR
jgi:hypothetical protein